MVTSPDVSIGSPVSPIRRLAGTWIALLVMAVVVLLSVTVIKNLTYAAPKPANTSASPTMPHSARMEDGLGIGFSRVAVVGDGGLVTWTIRRFSGASPVPVRRQRWR